MSMSATVVAEPATLPAEQPSGEAMSHRQILEALSGLLLGMFVAILSSTVVSNALPRILSDLHGGESAYTWVVTATLLATTVTTPIWGKLSDLFSKKLLVQLALLIFVASSAVAGLSQSPGMLIACRAFQGIGAGGLTALAQVVMAAMIAPRERGRYSGYLGAVFALATVGGPLIGGVLVDTSWLGWRWCFYVGVPFAAAAVIVLQKTLHLPVVKRQVRIDYWGATLLTAGVGLLLVWVSLAGQQFDWASWQTYLMVSASVVLLVLMVVVESRVAEPIIPMRLFRSRTVVVATVASLFVGVALFGATVFLSQYFQISRGVSPTKSGLMTLPLIGGLFLSSTIVGRLITKTGLWKRYLVLGGVLLTAGFAMMTTVRVDTAYGWLALYMALLGLGVGMMMQNLVLAVQNTVAATDLGAGSSTVAFFRSLGGAVGVSALGAVLSNRVTHFTETGLAAIGVHGGTSQGSAVPNVSALPAPIRAVVENAYGHATGDIFLAAAPFALLSLIAVLFIKEVPLRQSSGTERAAMETASQTAATEGTAFDHVDTAQTRDEVSPDAGTAQQSPTPVVADWGRVNGHVDHTVHGADDHDHHNGNGRLPGGRLVGSAAAVLTGHVRSDAGTAVHGATLTLLDAAGREVGVTETGSEGQYVLSAAGQETYLLVCAADGHHPEARFLTMSGSSVQRNVSLTRSDDGAGPRTGRLSGRVTDADGRPVAGAHVVATDRHGQVSGASTTGGQGRYELALDAGVYTIVANADGHQSGATTATLPQGSNATADLVVQRTGAICGTVAAAADRHPLPGATVVVDSAGLAASMVATDAAGGYHVRDLPSGTYTVVATADGPAAARAEVGGPCTTGVDLALPPSTLDSAETRAAARHVAGRHRAGSLDRR